MATRHQCGNCDWFALEPGKRKAGACLYRWKGSMYASTVAFNRCGNWVPLGTMERYEPEMIDDETGDNW